MSNDQVRQRGNNLLVTVFLFLIGLGMGPYALGEKGIDRFDDIGLFVIGVIALFWSLASSARFTGTAAPLVFSLLALVVQIGGIVFEFGDRDAFGDNFTGVVMLLGLTIVAIWQYARRPDWVDTDLSTRARPVAGAPFAE